MSFEFEHSEFSAETLALAQAIAHRSALEEAAAFSISAYVTGMPMPELPPEVQEAQLVSSTVLQLKRLEDASYSPTVAEQLASARTDGVSEAMAERWSEEFGTEVNVDQVQAVLEGTANEIEDRGVGQDYFNEIFARNLDGAKKVASLHGTDSASVIADDTLYYESQRAAYTPETHARLWQKTIPPPTGQSQMNVLVKQADQLLPQAVTDQLLPGELDELLLEMQFNPMAKEFLTAIAEATRESLKQAYLNDAVKIWGLDVIDTLSDDLRDEMLPVGPLAPEVRVSIAAAEPPVQEETALARMAISEEYSTEQGWDMAELTLQQILEIRALLA